MIISELIQKVKTKQTFINYLFLKLTGYISKYNLTHFTPHRTKRIYELYYKLGYIDKKTYRKMSKDTNWLRRWSILPKQVDKANCELNELYDYVYGDGYGDKKRPDHWIEFKEDGRCVEYRVGITNVEDPEEWSDNTEPSETEKQARAKYIQAKIEECKSDLETLPDKSNYLYRSYTKAKDGIKNWAYLKKKQLMLDSLTEAYTEVTNEEKPKYNVWC